MMIHLVAMLLLQHPDVADYATIAPCAATNATFSG